MGHRDSLSYLILSWFRKEAKTSSRIELMTSTLTCDIFLAISYPGYFFFPFGLKQRSKTEIYVFIKKQGTVIHLKLYSHLR